MPFPVTLQPCVFVLALTAPLCFYVFARRLDRDWRNLVKGLLAMSTSTQKKTATVSAIAIAAYNAGAADSNVIAVIKAAFEAGATEEQLKTEFRAGRIAHKIVEEKGGKATDAQRNAAIKKGLAICAACEPGRTPKDGQAVRTPEEQALFAPTKRWWSRTGRDAGVIKPRNTAPRNEEKNPPKKTPPKEVKPITLPKKPKSPKVAFDAVRSLSHLLATFCAKNVRLLPADVTAKCNRLSLELDAMAKPE